MGDKGIREHRREQILGPGSFVYGSGFISGLIESARLLLLQARDECQSRGPDNFLTLYGPSAIALAVTAFECSLNEILHTCLRTTPPGQLEEYRSLTRHDNLLAKFKTIPALVTGRPALENPDLELAQQVRHEIVHYYPRHIGTPSGVPEWLQPLVDKNLLCNSGAASGDICWEAKLQSFQLARWCGAAVANAAEQFETALNAEGRQMTGASFKAAGIASKFCKLVI